MQSMGCDHCVPHEHIHGVDNVARAFWLCRFQPALLTTGVLQQNNFQLGIVLLCCAWGCDLTEFICMEPRLCYVEAGPLA